MYTLNPCKQTVTASINNTTFSTHSINAIARGEGTKSDRLFTPGERKALANSKVHQ